jgi:acetyl-CoA carboxylase carboxyl transferase subunit alpha
MGNVADDRAIIGGVGCTRRPAGYRKALRLLRHAEKFGMPLISWLDTPGAQPGIQADELDQAQAIGQSLCAMVDLAVPIIAVVMGEGGTGDALAIGHFREAGNYTGRSIHAARGAA